MNKYLVKIASQSNNTSGYEVAKRTGIAAIATAVAFDKAPGALMGYHKIYHGTSGRNKESILKTGLNPKLGGSDIGGSHAVGTSPNPAAKKVSTFSSIWKERSRGKVHFTKSPTLARAFSQLNWGTGGDVVSGNISHRRFLNSARDVDMSGGFTTKHAIPTSSLKGSADYSGVKRFATGKNIRRYLSSPGGKTRFGLGLASIGIAAGTSALTAKSVSKYLTNNKNRAD